MPVRLVRHLLTLVWRGLGVELGLVPMVEQLDVGKACFVVPAHGGKGDGTNSQECLVALVDVADGAGLSLGGEGQVPWLESGLGHEGLEVQ